MSTSAAVIAEAMAELKSIVSTASPRGHECDLVNQFVESASIGYFDPRLSMTRCDTIVCEMAFKFGRADVVVFHVDGSATVIEVKDGTHGYNHVVSGIGQAGLYAAQLAMTKGAITVVRKALLWSSTGNVALDGVIEEVCESSNTIALPWPSISMVMAVKVAVSKVVSKERMHGSSL